MINPGFENLSIIRLNMGETLSEGLSMAATDIARKGHDDIQTSEVILTTILTLPIRESDATHCREF